MASHAEDIQQIKDMAQTIAANYQDPLIPDSRLGAAVVPTIQSLDPAKIPLPDNPTEMQKREVLGSVLNEAAEVALPTAALMPEAKDNPALCAKLSKDAIGRFDRYIELAAENAKRTFHDEEGAEKFYTPAGVSQLANFQLKNEAGKDKGIPPAAIGCEMPSPHVPINKSAIPGIVI